MNGAVSWILAQQGQVVALQVPIDGKEKRISLRIYPDVGLKEVDRGGSPIALLPSLADSPFERVSLRLSDKGFPGRYSSRLSIRVDAYH